VLFQLTYISGDVPACPNTRPVAERGANAHLGDVAERRENVSLGTPLGGGMCNRDCYGRVRASKITLSRAAHCSRMGRAWGGMHSNTNAHVAGFLAMQQPGLSRTGLCEWNNPQRGHAVQREGMHAGGHAQRRECARSQVPGDAAPFRLFNEFKKAHVRWVTICGRSGPIIGVRGTDTKNCTS